MSSGDSVTSICNIGLIEVGEDPVSSVNPPDNTKRAILCNQRYDQIRRRILRGSPFWNCARRQVRLVAASAAPLFTYSAAYPVPADFLRLVDLPQSNQATFEVMNLTGIGTCIVTNEGSPLDITYIFDLQDPTQMDPLLIEAIGFTVGAELAQPLGQDKTLAERAAAKAADAVASARLAGAQENSSQALDADLALRSRA